jgi:hypothetical protein
MKEELAQKAELAMVEIIDSLLKAKDFAVDQAPDVIRQLMIWNAIEWVGYGVLWITILGLCVWLLIDCIRKKEPHNDYEIGAFLSAVGCFIMTLSVFICVFGVLKIWLAPKVWLIEYAANLVK